MISIEFIVDEEEFSRHFDAQEISDICSQISKHILGLIAIQYGSKSPQRLTIEKLSYAMQLRLGVLGRIASNTIEDDPSTKVSQITLNTSVLGDDDEMTSEVYEHDLTSVSFEGLSPDTLLDFLLVLLEEGIKSIRSGLPEYLHYQRYGRECLAAARDMISELRPLAKIPYLPGPNSNALLASLCVKVEVNHSISK